MSDLYRDFIDQKADQIINSLGGTITPAPDNAELYRDFLDRKFDDVINAIGNVKVKSFTYTGDDAFTRTIKFPTIPKLVLSIDGKGTPAPQSLVCLVCPIHHNSKFLPIIYRRSATQGQGVPQISGITSFIDDTLIINTNTTYPEFAFNSNDTTYTVYYI